MKFSKKEYVIKLLDMIQGDYIIEGLKEAVKQTELDENILNSIISIFEDYSKKAIKEKDKKIINQSISELKNLSDKEKISIEKDKKDLDELENILNNL